MSTALITALGFVFDATQVAPSVAPEALPAGWYSSAITAGEIKPNDGGTGRRAALTWTVLEGPMKGRKIFDGIQIVHSNPDTQRIGQELFSAICHAVGVYQVPDLSLFFNKPHQVKIDIEPERFVDADNNDVPPNTPGAKKYDAKNRVRGVKGGSAPVVATSAALPAAAAPSWAVDAPAAPAAAAPVAAPVAAPAPVVAAPAAAAPSGKPKRGPKPKPAAAPVVSSRKFFVALDGAAYENAIPEAQIAEWLAKGMPADTGLCLEGEEDYKTAAQHGIGAQPAAPAVVPVVVAPAPAVVAAPVVAAAPAAPAPGALPWAQ